MPRRTVELARGHYYHVYNRGNNRQPIFMEPRNYTFFLKLMRQYFEKQVGVIAYCLMPNHYHLLLRLDTDGFSTLMHAFGTAYAKAINKERERVGAICQGPFKAALVEEDDYLLHLSRYIHLNPVRAGLVQDAAEWQFSSYCDYLKVRDGTLPEPDIVLARFSSADEYRCFVEEYQDADRTRISHLLFK